MTRVTTDAVTIVVVAKEPRPGKVKTRLCPPCVQEEAAMIAHAALVDTFTAVARVPASRHVALLDGAPGDWLPAGFDVVPQRAGTLGLRLAAAFDEIEGPVFLVGMDTPQVTTADIEAALRLMSRARIDGVLGRAPDGGWWALGLRRSTGRVFDGVVMSTDTTGAQQYARLCELRLRIADLPVRVDVDHFGDAVAVAAAMPPTSHFARAVAATNAAIDARALTSAP